MDGRDKPGHDIEGVGEAQMTSGPIAVLAGVPISLTEALGAALSLLAALAVLSLIALWRAGASRRREREIADERQEAIEARFAALAQSSAELGGRIGGMSEWLGSRQTDLARVVADRLDSVGARLGAGLESQAQTTGESLGKLNERLAVIDAAQSRMSEMTREVVSLKDILSNKQSRGAFGQGRMEAIVRDGLPVGAYEFQFTLSNRARPIASSACPATPGCSPLTPSSRSRVLLRCAPRATTRRAKRRMRGCAPTSASTSRTSPSAICCPARRRMWR